MLPDANQVRQRPLTFATHVLPAVGYAGVIFYTGLIKLGPLPEGPIVATDKLLHAVVFGALSLLLARAAHWLWPRTTLSRKLARGGVGSCTLGLLLEVCQAFTAYRSADVFDWVADTVGVLIALAVTFALFSLFPRRAHG
ncbi:MAG TPA: VanZ family protein [Polyangiaceae bacterium]|nr:VanZ family protein [Polyangiaceae bacterium]